MYHVAKEWNPKWIVGVVVFITVCMSTGLFPTIAAADIRSVNTQQLLPPGGNTCAPLSAYGFTPYVYEGALHSFEFTVPDAAYVALTGTVGDTPIPFQFMTRHGDATALRVHVDVETTPIPGTLPLSVTLLSAESGPVCMSVVLMTTVRSAATAPAPQGSTGGPAATQPPVTTPPSPSVGGVGNVTSTSTTSGTDQKFPVIDVIVDSGTTSQEAGPGILGIGNIQNRIVESCLAGAASRLWVILVAVYALIVIMALFVRPPASWDYSVGQRATTIVVPLVLLAAFWLFSEACRATTPWAWPLVISALIALAGLGWLYKDHPSAAPYVAKARAYWKDVRSTWGGSSGSSGSGSSSGSAPMITPPPSEKKKGTDIKF